MDKKDIQFGAFNTQIRGSSSSENAQPENAHLLDHNYAASAYDECFGDSWKGI